MIDNATRTKLSPVFVVQGSPSYNDIVPDEDQSELIRMAESMTEFSFRIGDIAMRISREAMEQGYRLKHLPERRVNDQFVTQETIDAAVGYFCKREGRTVRYYREVCQFFPQDVRDEFVPPLDFSMFVLARSFKDQWRDVLEYAASNPQKSKDAVEEHFIAKAVAVEGDAPEAVEGDERAEERAQVTGILSLFSRLVDAAQRAVSGLPVSDDMRRRGLDLVGEFRMWIMDTSNELGESQNQ